MQNLYEAILGEKNRIYYLTKFEKYDQQGLGLKASWNWPAFLCGGIWALYRKMYGWFFAFWGIAILSNIFEKTGWPGLSALIFFAPWVMFTFYANSLYHGNVKKKIAVAQFSIKDESKLLEFLRYKGGVHIWVIWIFGLLLVIGIITAIVIPLLQDRQAIAPSLPRVSLTRPQAENLLLYTELKDGVLRGTFFNQNADITVTQVTVEVVPKDEKNHFNKYSPRFFNIEAIAKPRTMSSEFMVETGPLNPAFHSVRVSEASGHSERR
jgi:hypothetical protein